MLEHLVGHNGVLWRTSPAMALVLLSTVPSSDPHVVRIREEILKIMPAPNVPPMDVVSLPRVRHVLGEFHCFPSPLVYVGCGYTDIQKRPSQYCNPYYFICTEPDDAIELYREYLDNRADLVQFLSPLRGAELICDCACGPWCHAMVLVEYVDLIYGCSDSKLDQKIDALNEACVLEGFDDDADIDPEDIPPLSSILPSKP